MTRLWLLRHARTAWNAGKRLQGRTDIPLDDVGRGFLAERALPADVAALETFTSPLGRARETARLLGAVAVTVEPALIEMDWGEWEGQTMAELRARLGAAMQANEDRGLDFRPEGGESPREVQARLAPWLVAMARRDRAALVVAHKGVMRALLASALGWDMTGRPPLKIDFSSLQGIDVDTSGAVTLTRPNRPLRLRDGAGTHGASK